MHDFPALRIRRHAYMNGSPKAYMTEHSEMYLSLDAMGLTTVCVYVLVWMYVV
jgi:hypothetical protein